jgi:hypothetical protein
MVIYAGDERITDETSAADTVAAAEVPPVALTASAVG